MKWCSWSKKLGQEIYEGSRIIGPWNTAIPGSACMICVGEYVDVFYR